MKRVKKDVDLLKLVDALDLGEELIEILTSKKEITRVFSIKKFVDDLTSKGRSDYSIMLSITTWIRECMELTDMTESEIRGLGYNLKDEWLIDKVID